MTTRYNNELQPDAAGWWVHITDHDNIVNDLRAENKKLQKLLDTGIEIVQDYAPGFEVWLTEAALAAAGRE
jgi:hypothetical protein